LTKLVWNTNVRCLALYLAHPSLSVYAAYLGTAIVILRSHRRLTAMVVYRVFVKFRRKPSDEVVEVSRTILTKRQPVYEAKPTESSSAYNVGRMTWIWLDRNPGPSQSQATDLKGHDQSACTQLRYPSRGPVDTTTGCGMTLFRKIRKKYNSRFRQNVFSWKDVSTKYYLGTACCTHVIITCVD